MKPKNNTMGISVSMPMFFLASDLFIRSPKLSYSGCATYFAGLSFANWFKSLNTFWLIVINPSIGLMKYFVKALSPNLFS